MSWLRSGADARARVVVMACVRLCRDDYESLDAKVKEAEAAAIFSVTKKKGLLAEKKQVPWRRGARARETV